MKVTLVATVLALGLLFFLAPTQTKGEETSDVVTLTSGNFKEQVNNGEDWLVEFFAPWCGHCKKLAPTWEKLATALKGKTNIGKVDCTQEKEVCASFGIRGYPTIKFLSKSQYYDYSGGRTIEAFSAFAQGGYSSASPKDFPDAYTEKVQASAKDHEL